MRGVCRQDAGDALTMTRYDSILVRVRELLSELCDAEAAAISADTELASLGIDSLDISEVLQAVVDEFGAEAPAAAVDHAVRVGDLVATLAASADQRRPGRSG